MHLGRRICTEVLDSILGDSDDGSSLSVKVIGPGRVGVDYVSSLAVL